MSMRLADRLRAARRRRFVGREGERELFRSLISADELPFLVLHVYGPGGVGKTTLLKEFAAICGELSLVALYIDARNIDAAPEGFLAALKMALGVDQEEDALDVMGSRNTRHVILLDTYEVLTPLDGWLRETFLPQVPADTLLVLADRRPLSPAWRSDPGWEDLVRTMPLRNLSPEQSRDYLDRRNIPSARHQEVLDFTHGHPLALSLVADVFAQRHDVRFHPEESPDVVKALLEQLVQKVPGPAHRIALEACALVRVTDEALLSKALGMEDVHELFTWLRDLSFIESGQLGLFPHDLAREALVADLRWRNRDWYAEMHRRIRAHYAAALERTSGLEQQRVLFDYVFLHRDNPVVRPFLEWQETGTLLPDRLRDEDVPLIVAMVAQHEGNESAEIARYWLARQPQGALVFRDPQYGPVGFLMMVSLGEVEQADLDFDPGVRAASAYLRSTATLRPGEIATLFRFWMGHDTYQDVSPMQSLLFINAVRHYFTPGLVFTFLPCANADFWAPLFAYADLARIPQADFEVGGRHYGTYGHNWRAVPPMAWLAILAERETGTAPVEPPSATAEASAPLAVLSQDEFTAAANDALRNLARTDALKRNPILQSRLVTEAATPNATLSQKVTALQELLRKACDALQESPREVKLYRAVYHTYVSPAPTQEQAAELLDVPFSTYRRHLKEGMARIADLLWEWEVGAGG
jgi:hypothetical protein